MLVGLSYILAAADGWEVFSNVEFRSSNFWDGKIDEADVVSCFGIAPVMQKLADKINTEAKHNCEVLTFRFHLPPQSLPKYYFYDKESELRIYRVVKE